MMGVAAEAIKGISAIAAEANFVSNFMIFGYRVIVSAKIVKLIEN